MKNLDMRITEMVEEIRWKMSVENRFMNILKSKKEKRCRKEP